VCGVVCVCVCVCLCVCVCVCVCSVVCVCVCVFLIVCDLETSKMRRPRHGLGRYSTEKKIFFLKCGM